MPKQATEYPIFAQYSLDELSRRLGYSLIYLVDIREGRQEARPRFRLNAAGILNRTQAELFDADEATS